MTSQPQTSFQPETVPQLDMSAQYAAIGGDIRTAVERVMASQQFVLGREGMALEEELAKLCGVAHGVGLASGTDALILALRACGVHALARNPITSGSAAGSCAKNAWPPS